ncbi:zinc finger BED domain-containing protein 4-like [Daktulosphaira vitifoliae]|uniref:zinc finger BED domain-containing protein 4-like n=1 Tax=Daktulosphaira vitifoliae TaxID=58002 RepID=UPI0021A9ABD7|nr:zinc finger BED domain-containing protein 4-like [Daktulosphaira vitifoliae]
MCGWRHVGCYAHSLNLVVQTALKSISEIRDKVRGIVGHFKRSLQAAEKLINMQIQLGLIPPLMLIQDVVTRWNSTYEMFQRILDLKIPLSSVLVDCHYDAYLSNNDWLIISKTCEILKYFKEITVEISSEKCVSISKSIVFSRALLKYCTHLENQSYDSPQLTNMVSKLNQQVQQRFGSLEKIQILAEATILDPRFKKFGFFSERAFLEGKKTLIDEATLIRIENSIPIVTQNQPSVIGGDSIWNDFDEEVSSQLISTNPTSVAIIEIDKYLQEGQPKCISTFV